MARYLGARGMSPGAYTSFQSYMTMDEVRNQLLKRRLGNVENHARQFLSGDAKRALLSINTLLEH